MTATSAGRLTPRDLHNVQPIRRLVGRNSTKADILVYRLASIDVAVKDYAARPRLVRHLLGRWLTRRETAAYRALAGLPGVAPFLGRLGPWSLATGWLDAEPLSKLSVGAVDPRCFDRLAELIDAVHRRGVALADLHHRDVLVGRDGAVHVVDLAAAWILGPRPSRLRRRIFARLCDADLVALARMRARFTGADVGSAPASVGRSAAAWHGRGRRLKRLWDSLRRA